jgi:hypothetical protein
MILADRLPSKVFEADDFGRSPGSSDLQFIFPSRLWQDSDFRY